MTPTIDAPAVPGATLTRFAPAPTGWLHLGHVVNALFVWETARRSGCRVALRIEDHDRGRCRPEYEAGILDDLDWLGFVPHVYPTGCFRAGSCAGRQSDRGAIYRRALERLRQAGLVYACSCSRRLLASSGGSTGERRYPGTCRTRNLPFADGFGLRVRLHAGIESFDDVLLGPQRQEPSRECGDVLVRDRRGNWTYQFAVAVDDMEQGVDLIVRGVDLLHSTGRQIQLARLLGRQAPAIFAHHPLVMKTPDRKLSKADQDVGIRDLRAAGWTPEQVRGEAAARVAARLADRPAAADPLP